MDKLWYMLAAFSIVWSVVWGYTFFMSRKQSKLIKELEQLKNKIGNIE